MANLEILREDDGYRGVFFLSLKTRITKTTIASSPATTRISVTLSNLFSVGDPKGMPATRHNPAP